MGAEDDAFMDQDSDLSGDDDNDDDDDAFEDAHAAGNGSAMMMDADDSEGM